MYFNKLTRDCRRDVRLHLKMTDGEMRSEGEAPSSVKPGFTKAHPTSEKTKEGCACLKGQLSGERG